MAYDYTEAMKQDIRDYIEDNDIELAGRDRDEVYNTLNDELWTADSVTGNASGSYTFNTAQAREYVEANIPLCMQALTEFGTEPKVIMEKFTEGAWEWLDVTIRCYLLGSVLGTVLEDIYDHMQD